MLIFSRLFSYDGSWVWLVALRDGEVCDVHPAVLKRRVHCAKLWKIHAHS